MKLKAFAAVFALSSCGPSVSGPAEISYGGLTYDVRDGGNFIGLPVANDLPNSGTAEYNGVLRMNASSDEYYNGTSKLVVDFATASGSASGRVDFKGENGLGIYSFDRSITVDGTSFVSQSEDQIDDNIPAQIVGDFYGDDASVVGATVFGQVNGVTVNGVMIAKTVDHRDRRMYLWPRVYPNRSTNRALISSLACR
ncbi:MAG: hypothetical protein U5N55_14075 [Cypionkella sp.]|nr:hypothetical protein [Cypionkella sp.]